MAAGRSRRSARPSIIEHHVAIFHAAVVNHVGEWLAPQVSAATAIGIGMLIAAAALGGCSKDGPDLAGTWKSDRTTLTITQHTNNYQIVADNPQGVLNGRYTSEYRDRRLLLNGPLAPLCGDLKYTESDRKLEFCTEQFVRSKP
jgi:hypothetical protein